MVKAFLKQIALKCGYEIRRKQNKSSLLDPISLFPEKSMKGSVLLSYLVDPFLVAENDLLFNKHTNYWECLQIAKTFLNMGYRVDVISGPSFPGDQFIPKRD